MRDLSIPYSRTAHRACMGVPSGLVLSFLRYSSHHWGRGCSLKLWIVAGREHAETCRPLYAPSPIPSSWPPFGEDEIFCGWDFSLPAPPSFTLTFLCSMIDLLHDPRLKKTWYSKANFLKDRKSECGWKRKLVLMSSIVWISDQISKFSRSVPIVSIP